MPRSPSPPCYRGRADFRKAPGREGAPYPWRRRNPFFVIQLHHARTRHFDFRLEVEGVLKSWAVPKGPSTDPRDKRLAVRVADHDVDYADFEGVIPEGKYGAGTVIVWDAGPYQSIKRDVRGRRVSMREALAAGNVEVWLEGRKIRGGYALVRTRLGGKRETWLLVKMRDAGADARRKPAETEPESVLSGRTADELE